MRKEISGRLLGRQLGPACPGLFAAGLADHLQGSDLQVRVLLLARCPLHLSLFFLFRLRLIGAGTSDGHGVTEVFVQLDAGTVESPGLAVFTGDGKLTGLVTLL